MANHDDFWLQVHDLSLVLECHQKEVRAARLAHLADDFQQYPPVARRQLSDEFKLVLAAFRELEKLLRMDSA